MLLPIESVKRACELDNLARKQGDGNVQLAASRPSSERLSRVRNFFTNHEPVLRATVPVEGGLGLPPPRFFGGLVIRLACPFRIWATEKHTGRAHK